MSVAEGLPDILGKQIVSAMAKEGASDPRYQVFLVFDDNTYIEFYSSSRIFVTHCVRPGGIEAARQYMPQNKIIFECGAHLDQK